MSTAACPTPLKVRLPSLAFARRVAKKHPRTYPYLCVCGFWHTGHSSAKKRERQRR